MTTKEPRALSREHPVTAEEIPTPESVGSALVTPVRIFRNGDELFQSIALEIERAEESILLETYIFEPDSVGVFILDALIRALKRGLHVQIIIDGVGSFSFPREFVRRVEENGGSLRSFNVPSIRKYFQGGWKALPPTLRDHRKALVIDDRIVYLGGMNIGRSYAGPLSKTFTCASKALLPKSSLRPCSLHSRIQRRRAPRSWRRPFRQKPTANHSSSRPALAPQNESNCGRWLSSYPVPSDPLF